MAQKHQGCVQAAKGPLTPAEPAGTAAAPPERSDETMTARVGQPAPDFEATAYVGGDFANIKLSDYKGRWVTLCFYPGDFTFV